MTCIYTKIFGERNCGAAYLRRLVERNFATQTMHGAFDLDRRVLRLALQAVRPRDRTAHQNTLHDLDHERTIYSDFGWVHAAPPIDVIRSAPHAESTLFLLITKHPAHFLASLHANPTNPRLSEGDIPFERFLQQPWPVLGRDGVEEAQFETPMALWNAKVAAGFAMLDMVEHGLHLAYEDLLSDFEGQMARIAEHLPPVTGDFANIRRSIRAKDNLTFEDYQRRYKYQRLKTHWRKRDLELIYRRIDTDLLRRAGYREVL
ncbi:MAG: hypothetical protein AAGE18_03810 [Pseudomonadota bacterium]